MKKIYLSIALAVTAFFALGQQKVVGDCTATYSITSNTTLLKADLSGSVKTFYVKGKISRTDLNSPNYQQSIIYDNATGAAVVLQQVGTNRYMTKLTAEKWGQRNANYRGIVFSFSDSGKVILGYECKKGSAVLKDGSVFSFYYATAIVPSATENPFQFKDIPGFVLQYSVAEKNNGSQFTYTATKINFSPVPASMFDIPASGYLVRDE